MGSSGSKAEKIKVSQIDNKKEKSISEKEKSISEISNNFTLGNQTKNAPYEKLCETAAALDGIDRISQYVLKVY